MDFKQLMERYREDMIKDLQALIAIPSLNDMTNASTKAPFGEAVNDALIWFLNKAKSDGFDVDNVDGYAGICSFNSDAKESIGVLGHLDIVPVGEGWSKDPFGGEIEDGILYGRGSGDDKGPTIAAYYAMKLLKSFDIQPKKKIELIVGTDEETGMRCMEYYKNHRIIPNEGFVPDAAFPVIYGEKGILNIDLNGEMDTVIHSMHAGERPNIVVGKASVTITQMHNPEKLDYYCQAFNVIADAKMEGAYTTVTFYGKYAHASMPEKGLNAAYHALNYVGTTYNDTLAQNLAKLTKGYLGEGLNIMLDGVHMGFLTANLGIVSIEQNKYSVVVDIRYPNDTDGDTLVETIKSSVKAVNEKMDVRVIENKPPHFVDPSSTLVTTLTQVYQKYSNDTFTPALTMGGGTYARTLPNFVAYGMNFIKHPLPNHVGGPHEKDEGIYLEDLFLASVIYAEALYKLAYENS